MNSTTTAAAPPPPPPAAADPAAVADRAAADVAATRAVTTQARRPTELDRATRGVAQAVREGGVHAVHEHLHRHPEHVRALANARPSDLDAAFARCDAPMACDSIVREHLDSRLRVGILRVGNERLNERVGDLRTLERNVIANLDTYRNAAPGTAKAAVAEALGIVGDEGDAGRVRAAIGTAVEGLTSLRDTLAEQTIVPGDFPETAREAGRRERWSMARGSLAAELATGSTTEGNQIDDITLTAVKVGETAMEAGHIAHAIESLVHGTHLGQAALDLGVYGLGLAAGSIIHHAAEERHRERIEALHTFGVD
ncbi:MAG: hypothetical protein H6724_06055 [Sandaracinus sp.]|nr:hypothetical protein [Sandaracinus sp.]MCB9624729.1 hypothetical protein [Sandaracinus sp.]